MHDTNLEVYTKIPENHPHKVISKIFDGCDQPTETITEIRRQIYTRPRPYGMTTYLSLIYNIIG